ncbi:glycerol 3-phosphate dehydrogenase (NAD(P)+) [Cyclonatronum proteinivorum]|uniref:Glycerol-3-phosphate dehydrogenase [NAD(P)+] n=2 Tax=Cyclonatronum proteinivorum TaxID=1457365 RepID=A0A345UGP7_9BACT|nr:glycerol 3-phosphate dehydrogenase (NAD(P)+) [Cyclonatronum proteinivorum]
MSNLMSIDGGPKARVTVIGAGSWGTALALVLADSGHEVTLWAREPEVAAHINAHHSNPSYLKGCSLPEHIRASADYAEALADAEVVLFATPSHVLRTVASAVKPLLRPEQLIISVVKGIENDTYYTMTQVLREVLGGVVSEDQISTLYGPSHAEEVAARKPTVVVVASYSARTAKTVQKLFTSPMFRVYINRDILGVEVSGSIKNIMAIAAGVAEGAGFGDNAIAALVTRGLQEMKRLGMRLGASQDTFAGLAGVGDLVVTCTSGHSRNRTVGKRIGQGEKLEDIISHMNMVAEGVKTTRSVYGWAQRLGVEMPITEAVHAVLFEGLNPRDGVYRLMTREQKEEIIY